MKPETAARIVEQTKFEAARTGYPEGFPALPPMPAARYTDPGFHRLEMEHLFRKAWLLVGHESDLTEVGDYRLFDRLGVPILLIRGDDEKIRAFYNSCQHRGAPVVRDECGRAQRLTCRYHAWTYDTLGRLVRVPHERDFCGLDKTSRGLRAIRCERWQGFLFVNLDETAESLSSFMASLDPDLADELSGPQLRTVYRATHTVPCNWKIAQEAFLEAYHVPVIHPKTAALILDYPGTAIALFANGHSRMVHPLNEARKGLIAGSNFGVPPIPTMGPVIRELSTAYGIFPNITTPMNGFLIPIIQFWPVDVRTTTIDWTVFGMNWGAGEKPAGFDAFGKAFHMIMEEDYQNLAPMQRSVESGGLRSVPLCYQERRIYHFNQEIDRRIGVDRIPESLRMTPVELPLE